MTPAARRDVPGPATASGTSSRLRRVGLGPAARAAVGAVVALALVACGDGDGADAVEPVDAAPRPASTVMLPRRLPDGFAVTAVEPGGGGTYSRALLIGPERGLGAEPMAEGRLVVVGSSDGSASIAGPPSARGRPVDGLDAGGAVPASVVEDGPWTWVVFDAEPTCHEDCLDFVAGRGVPSDDLVAIARSATFDADGDATQAPAVDAAALPEGLAPLATVAPADGIVASGTTTVQVRSTGAGGGWMTVLSTPADPALAAYWAFWVDDTGTTIRGHGGRAGPTGAMIDAADVSRVWVEGDTLVAVLGWRVDDATVDTVVAGLEPGTAEDLGSLTDTLAQRPILAADVGCAEPDVTILSGSTGVDGWRWAVGLGQSESPPSMVSCEAFVDTTGTAAGGGGGSLPLAPVGQLTVSRLAVAGTPVEGGYVYGAAPPATTTVELVLPDGSVVPAAVAETGPRTAGERWFAVFLTDGQPVAVVARDGAGAELARSDLPPG